jgi:hypothetical protein
LRWHPPGGRTGVPACKLSIRCLIKADKAPGKADDVSTGIDIRH